MLLTTDADLISVNETHLPGDTVISLPGYSWFGYNRQFKHCRAPITHGGVGIFVSTHVMNCFNVCVIDKSFDGIRFKIVICSL